MVETRASPLDKTQRRPSSRASQVQCEAAGQRRRSGIKLQSHRPREPRTLQTADAFVQQHNSFLMPVFAELSQGEVKEKVCENGEKGRETGIIFWRTKERLQTNCKRRPLVTALLSPSKNLSVFHMKISFLVRNN